MRILEESFDENQEHSHLPHRRRTQPLLLLIAHLLLI
jgi:hypothetical protein